MHSSLQYFGKSCYCTVLYCAVLCCTVLYCIILQAMLSQNMGSKYLLYFTVLCVLYCAAMSCFFFLHCNDFCFPLASAACILSLQGICSACFAQRAYGPGRHQGGFGSDHHGPQDSSSSCKKHKTSFYNKNKQQNTTILETTKTSFDIGTVLYCTVQLCYKCITVY